MRQHCLHCLNHGSFLFFLSDSFWWCIKFCCVHTFGIFVNLILRSWLECKKREHSMSSNPCVDKPGLKWCLLTRSSLWLLPSFPRRKSQSLCRIYQLCPRPLSPLGAFSVRPTLPGVPRPSPRGPVNSLPLCQSLSLRSNSSLLHLSRPSPQCSA